MAPTKRPNSSRKALSTLSSNSGPSTAPAAAKQTTLADMFAKQRAATLSDGLKSPYSGGMDSTIGQDSSDEDSEQEHCLKRRRIQSCEPDSPPSAFEPRQRRLKTTILPGQQISQHDMLSRFGMAPAHKRHLVSRGKTDYSHYTTSFVSHNIYDVYRVDSLNPDRAFSTPFGCQFTHEAKRGGKQIMAVASEEGTVSLLDTDLTSEVERPSRTMLQPHENAIFDFKFSKDDCRIATVSGDQLLCISDVRTGQTITRTPGHVGSIKSVQWDPFHECLLATGSRDGTIRVWDTRTQVKPLGQEDAHVEASTFIRNAHGKKITKYTDSRTAIRSVTALAYLGEPSLLASAGSFSGQVKVWDLRMDFQRRINPPALHVSPDFSLESNFGRRSHGIASIILSPDCSTLYALSTSSQIHALDAHNISRPDPMKTFTAERKIHPSFRLSEFDTGSFYMTMALSVKQSGRFLAVGSKRGAVWLFDTESPAVEPVSLNGHAGDICGLDFGAEGLASCADDATVRLWRSDASVAKKAQETDMFGYTAKRSIRPDFSGNWLD